MDKKQEEQKRIIIGLAENNKVGLFSDFTKETTIVMLQDALKELNK